MNTKILASIKLEYFPIKKGLRLLDFGFGDGSKSILFSQEGLHITAADIDNSNINALKSYMNKNKIKNINLTKLGEIGRLPFKANYFDRIIINEVLEHIPNYLSLLEELNRIIKPAGIICLSVPTEKSEIIYSKINNSYLKKAGHIHIFRETELIRLIEAQGFRVTKITYENFQFALFWLIQSCFNINPTQNGKLRSKPKFNKIYWGTWGFLYISRLANLTLLLGNKIFPKSIYIYAEKK